MLGRPTVNVDAPWYFRRFIRNVLGQATRTITQSQRALASPIDEAPLHIADTRPAMFFGIPHVSAVLLIAAFGESIVFVGPLWACWVAVPAVAIRLAVRRDYHAPRCFVLWLLTKALSLDARTWYGASPAPFPISAGKYPRGIWP